MEAKVCFLYRDLRRLFPRSWYSLIAGRSFTVRDRSDAPLVRIVDQSMAKEEWPGQNPIGKCLHIGNPKRSLPWATVVGVVPDVRIDAPDQPAGEQWYFPLEQPAIIEGSGVTGTVDLSSGWIALRSMLLPEQFDLTGGFQKRSVRMP